MSSSHENPKVRNVMTIDPTPVSFINKEVYDYAAKQATGNAYQAVAQSMAQMIQNANTTLLNTEALVQATQAVFMKKAASAPSPAVAAKWAEAAAKAAVPLTDMIKFVGDVGTTADDILNGFPVGRGNVPSASQEEEVL